MSITAPTNPTATAVAVNQINLTWGPSTTHGSSVGGMFGGVFGGMFGGSQVASVITGYRVFRNGVQVGTTNAATLFFADMGLTPNTTYSYFIIGVDSLNEQTNSATVRATTFALAPVPPPIVVPPGFVRRPTRNLYPLFPIPDHDLNLLPVAVIGKYIRVWNETAGQGLCIGDFDPTLGMFWLDVQTGLPIGGTIVSPITQSGATPFVNPGPPRALVARQLLGNTVLYSPNLGAAPHGRVARKISGTVALASLSLASAITTAGFPARTINTTVAISLLTLSSRLSPFGHLFTDLKIATQRYLFTRLFPTVSRPPPSGRAWLFIPNPGGDQFRWAGENSGWAAQPMDGLHTQTDQTDSGWFGDSVAWSPTPKRFMMSNQFVNPGALDTAGMAAGNYNATWLGWLKQGSRQSLPIKIVRIWQECNANFGFAWQKFSTTAQFISAFRNMAMQVRTAYPNALIDFNLNYNVSSNFGNGSTTSYDLYPGDDVVNIISLDGYEKNTAFSNLQTGSGVNLNNLASFAQTHGKLVGIGETAAHGCDGSWITSMASFMDSLGSSAGYLSYYDQGLANNGDNVIYTTSGTDACSASTLQAAVNSSSIGTKPYSGPF